MGSDAVGLSRNKVKFGQAVYKYLPRKIQGVKDSDAVISGRELDITIHLEEGADVEEVLEGVKKELGTDKMVYNCKLTFLRGQQEEKVEVL